MNNCDTTNATRIPVQMHHSVIEAEILTSYDFDISSRLQRNDSASVKDRIWNEMKCFEDSKPELGLMIARINEIVTTVPLNEHALLNIH